jgi:formamidopyrimidine-DNA glycosylase
MAVPDALLFSSRIAGQRIVSVGRRAKFLVLGMASGDSLLIHLRMTGRLSIEPGGDSAPEDPYVRAWLDLADGRRLIFSDPRKFGRIWLVDDASSVLGGLGPEPLGPDFTPEILAERLRRRRVAIKSLLLNQTVVAGLGNIYADESLFLAGIHPLRPAANLTGDEIQRLWAAIRQVLGEAVSERGTTLRDYRPPNGGKGHYQEVRRVYGLAQQPCPRCGNLIERRVISQRSAHYCPRCQPRVEAMPDAPSPEQP